MMRKIELGLNLFRYNIEEPNINWDSKLHALKSEYNYEEGTVLKNEIGAYFFYDTKEAAINTAQIAVANRSENSFWLTQTSTQLEIDICIKDFKLNGLNRDLSELVNCNNDTRLFPTLPIEIELSYFGQLLTDFNNGKVFLKLLAKSKLNLGGYTWRESPDGLTYCLFNHNKLFIPTKEKITINKEE
jgi:hypothetical protein